MSEVQESLEWHSIREAVQHINVRAALPLLESRGVVAYTDGACIKNPGGPAGWAAILCAAFDFMDGELHEDAACIECSGHVPSSEGTTNNRAEIAAVLAVVCIAPQDLPLLMYSDSDYTIKVAQGIYKMKANPDLWALYRAQIGIRKAPITFEWVRGHGGDRLNERADELAGIAAWKGDVEAYRKWRASTQPEAHNPVPPAEMALLEEQVNQLKIFLEGNSADVSRVSTTERTFINDMARRLQKNKFVPSPAQSNWVKILVKKYRV